ncbi:GMC oxidoreductase [Hydrogenophaga sp.]|uniref:GMC oxidoreductase n=1 Tax=Hydrogenophaga sp. TaxID=1904254 RepID=UPI003D118D50
MIEDFDSLAVASEVSCDVCIVGTGPAGLAVATSLANTRLDVIVLETGGEHHEAWAEALSAFESVGARRAGHMSVRRRIFGGTSVLWSGRCVPFAPTDYQPRAWVPNSGWPIDAADVAPYLDRAGALLGTGPGVYDDRLWRMLNKRAPQPAWDPASFEWQYFQASLPGDSVRRQVPGADDDGFENLDALMHSGAPAAIDVAQASRRTLAEAANIRVWLHAHVRSVNTEPDGSTVTGVTVQRKAGELTRVKARAVVLACGGIDNARLLLLSDEHAPNGVGNAHDQVGRYLMDHHYAAIGTVPGEARRLRSRFRQLWFDRHGQRHVYVTGASLSAQRQREERLTRGTVYLFEHVRAPAPVSSLGSVLRAFRSGDSGRADAGALGNLGRHPVRLLEGAYDRYVAKRPAFTLTSQVDIGCNVEQWPDAQSRVTLSDQVDDFGQRRARIDWRIHDVERQTYAACARLIEAECRRLQLEMPLIAPWLRDPEADWRSNLHDMAHPMGTTRMSASPENGVVDANCAVHGTRGLYIAGSSVFSTGGTGNPTLLIAALGFRLADHLRKKLLAVPTPKGPADMSTPDQPTTTSGGERIKVGIVGAGDRVRRIYGPVLKALDDRIEVVGFFSRDREKGAAFGTSTGWPYHASLDELLQRGQPAFLVVAVNGAANAGVLYDVIARGLPVLAETPIAWDERTARGIVAFAAKRGVQVGVAEQFPNLPEEALKLKLISLGILGTITSAINEFATFDYHGIAQLRAYLGGPKQPVSATAVEYDFGATGVVEGVPPPVPALAWPERWLLGTVKHADGALLVHNYSSGYSVLPTRPQGRLLVHGACGSLVDHQLLVVNRHTGETHRSEFRRDTVEGEGGTVLRGISVDTPGFGEVEWRNPFDRHALSDEQIAVATHVAAMIQVARQGALPLYPAASALQDIEYLRALTYSARRGGAPVGWPVATRYQQIRVALSPAYFGQLASKVLGKLGRRAAT